MSVTPLNEWMAAWSLKELDHLRQEYPDITDVWDETCGDRCNQLVFIGKGYEKAGIVSLLYRCLEGAA